MKRFGFWSRTSLGWKGSASSHHASDLYSPYIRDLIYDLSAPGEKHQEKFSRLEQKAPLEKGLRLKRRLGISKILTCIAFPLASALVEAAMGIVLGTVVVFI